MPESFATTQWSVVVAAGDSREPARHQALGELCQAYWYPLYAYARRRFPVADAQELTQEFFVQLLEKNTFAAADPHRGRFRSFLLASFQNFLANEHKRKRAAKRGGRVATLSLEFTRGEARLLNEPVDPLTPEKRYARQWALTLLERVLTALREEFAAHGKAEIFAQLQGFLAGSLERPSYAEAARALGVSEGAARVAAHRLRGRYRELLRASIAQTVAHPSDVDDEIRELFQALED